MLHKYYPFSLRDKLILMAILLVTVPTLIIGYFVETEGRSALLQEKRNKLYSVAGLLEQALNDEYDLAVSLPREQRLALISEKLYPAAETITSTFPGVGAGYYHRELDGIVTYSPRARYGNKTGTRISEDHPGRHVMATGEPEVGWGTQVRGNIMNAMIPVRRNGEVAGYIWANELTDDIDRQALAMDIKIIAVIAIGILFSLLIIIVFSRHFSRDIGAIKSGLSDLSHDLNTHLPMMKGEMGEISDSVNALAQTLREMKTLNELIIESAADGVIAVDINGCVTMINPAAEEITGYLERDLHGKYYGDVFEGRNFSSPVLDTLKRGIEHVSLEIEYPARDHTIQINVSTSRIRNAGGELIGALVIFKDLTAQKEVQRRMQQAEKLATLGELMAGVAHEVRNPLTAISGFVQILKELENHPDKLEYISIILKEVDSIDRIIRQLLDFSRPQTGTFRPISVNRLIEEALVLVKTKGVEARVTFTWVPDETLPLIEANSELLRQVLLNIMINAVQSIPARGNLFISTCYMEEQRVMVVIRDDGTGIPAALQKKIFDPFFTTKASGTGLGLAISQRIIAGHGGDIFLESQEHHGTTFTITLPITQGKKNDYA